MGLVYILSRRLGYIRRCRKWGELCNATHQVSGKAESHVDALCFPGQGSSDQLEMLSGITFHQEASA